ncbi:MULTISPECIES: glycerate kinase [Amycolatopsis]|uniref:Glycerate kinase n=1 Tax=Amycolatopsis albidoflavus TaxID=102226 RepID=A0ABW5I017_9PSEU
MKVLLAPDKFKGSLSAAEVAAHLADGLADRGIDSHPLTLADGGDGSVAAALSSGFRPVPITVSGATGQLRRSVLAFDGTTAVVEVASTCGLQTLPDGPAPLSASSRGFGEALGRAIELGPRRVVLALGGSASTDGGAGMLAALGAVFTDRHGRRMETLNGRTLPAVAAIDLPRLDVEIVIATDVRNPLLGPSGAAAVYGPQKGAAPADIAYLNAGLDHFVQLADARSLADTPGAGAAGGIGFAALLLGGKIVSGADFFLDLLDFPTALRSCDLVVTGEGRIDSQTAEGKLAAAVARRSDGVPVIAVVGHSVLAREDAAALGLSAVHALTNYSTDPAADPRLSGELLRRIARTIELPGRENR